MAESSSPRTKQCCLCGRSEGYMVRFERWSEEEREYALRHLSEPPPRNSVTCKRDRLEARRHCHTQNHVPKWKSILLTPSTIRKCLHPQCIATSQDSKIIQIQTAIPRDTVRDYLQLSTDPEGPYTLCMKHYSQLYRHIYPYTCSSCGATPKPSTTFTRHSPDAHRVSKQLTEIMDTTITIRPTDWICNRCYKIHLNILKDTNSSDEVLQQDIRSWKDTCADTSTDKLTRSILSTVIIVAEHILDEKAVLLPQISQTFLEIHEIPPTRTANLEVGDTNIKFTSKWLLHQLLLYLHPYMVCKCVHRKFGTMLLRKGGDMLVSLSWALGSSHQPTNTSNDQKMHVIEEAGDIINDLLHDELRKSPEVSDSMAIDIEDQFSNINPLITKFTQLTPNIFTNILLI